MLDNGLIGWVILPVDGFLFARKLNQRNSGERDLPRLEFRRSAVPMWASRLQGISQIVHCHGPGQAQIKNPRRKRTGY
jgi:hypothetical protein